MNLVMESERLRLRPLEADDIDLGSEMLTDPDVMRFVGGETYAPERVLEEMEHAVRRGADGWIGVWCVIDKATGEKLGTAILLPLPIEERDTNWDLVQPGLRPDAEIEIGYVFKKTAWGKGYATEACTRLLRFAFEESPLDEVVAVTAPENHKSQHVLGKCGLRREGQRRAYSGDCPGFRITRDQWLAALPT